MVIGKPAKHDGRIKQAPTNVTDAAMSVRSSETTLPVWPYKATGYLWALAISISLKQSESVHVWLGKEVVSSGALKSIMTPCPEVKVDRGVSEELSFPPDFRAKVSTIP
jgi:hypothetical protein